MGFPNYAIKGKKNSLAVLDIGTNKVACFIAQPNAEGNIQIKGIGHHLAKGIRGGMITDSHEAESSIISAVHAAEQMAGEGNTVENVVVSISGSHLRSHNVSVELRVAGEGVSERDIADILREGCNSVQSKERSIIHCFAAGYEIDGARGIRDPRHMFGQRLAANLHLITADNVKIRNLAGCIGRCHLNVSEFIVGSHAAALGVLDADEMDLGVVLVNMGAGETSFSVFLGGMNIYSDVIPIGGQHVTSDIARGLSTSMAHAERLKVLHGSAIALSQDNQAMVEVPLLGEDEHSEEANLVPRAMLIGIIRPRLEEIFEILRERLEMSGMLSKAGRNVVLTGGACQLIGLRELVTRILNKQVRIAKPHLVNGLADSVSGPAFSATVGMLTYATNRPLEDTLFQAIRQPSALSSRTHKLMNWMRENF